MKLKSQNVPAALAPLLAALLVTVAWAGWPHHTMRPTPQHGIPNRDYDYPQFSHPAFALSRPALPLAPELTREELALLRPAPLPALPQRKLFQLDTPRVRVDHCAVSRFSLVIDEHGNWLLSAAGRQGLVEAPAAGDVMTERQLTVLPPRNQFRLTVRGYPATTAPDVSGLEALGRPALFQLPVQAFWVQRNATRLVRAGGTSEEVRTNFRWVDRVELEFAYR